MDNKHRLLLTVSFLVVVGILFGLYLIAPAKASDCKIILKREISDHKPTPKEIKAEFNQYLAIKKYVEDLTGCEVS